MHNDSIETLLLRHYGSNSPTPEALEQRLCASVHQEAQEIQQRQSAARRLCEQRISRRRAVQLVAMGSAGLGLLSASVASVQSILSSQEGTRPAYS
ncbi:hypothetical protein [Dictyobacter aurantiacus]|uniref:Uncharacterized protein n=1 Tax=Dictyobacter aurantiacus TaxID=1936993 RepID=A0A401ZF95_9CHLR|nr:hypothetical protein [Dictyobacter aurantiacus]GCE05537.1 hypothetical protein KDAU_28660 [Dictyobacter aurantiacus]